MKTFTIALAASVLLAAAPFVLAAEGAACDAAENFDYVKHPLGGDRYLFINPSVPQKLGEWVEANGNAGLQTELCYEDGTLVGLTDLKSSVLA